MLSTTTIDCQPAREVLLRAAKEAFVKCLVRAQTAWRETGDNDRSANPPLEPTVTPVVGAGSSEFTVRRVVDYIRRTAMQDRLLTKIAEEVAKSSGRLAWASPAVTLVRQSAPDVVEPQRPSSVNGPSHTADSH